MALFRSGGIRIALGFLLLLAICAGIGAAVVYALLIRDLPDFTSLDDYNPPVVSEVYDRNGLLIGEYYTEQRRLVPIDEIPRHVQLAFVAAEDGAFFEHGGIDFVSIARAAFANLQEGGIAQGASTITQQMVKSLLLSPERTYKRKMREIILARQIEQHFSKDEILYLYLNQIYFGNSAWGIGQAARAYFGKDAQALTVSEAALLAGLPQRPSAYNPTRNPESAEARRRYVLGRMLSDGYIDETVYETELAALPEIKKHTDYENVAVAGYFTEEVRRLLFEKLDGDLILNKGLRIDTTLDVTLQRTAREAVQNGLVAHDHRRGYRGPIRQVGKDALDAELEQLAENNRKTFDAEEIEAVEASARAASTGLPQVAANAPESASETRESAATSTPPETEKAAEKAEVLIAYSVPFKKPLEGVVVSVDAKSKTARIAFGEGLEGVASLSDNDWAREPNLESRPRPVEKITSIFKVGDIAEFIRLPDAKKPAKNEEGEIEPRLTIWQEPKAEGALLSLDNRTGDVIAMVGGYDFGRSEFNRAVQAQRQPGSAFKPFIYGAALTRGYTPVSTLIDRPVVYTDPASGFVWAPRNYGRKFYGPMTMRDALKKSINNATVHLFRDLGVRYVIDYARRFGIQAPLSADLSLALGSSSVTLLELTRAYAVYPRGGSRVIPRFITQVTDAEGNVLLSDVPLGEVPPPVLKPLARVEGEEQEESYPDSEITPTQQIVSPADAYLVADLLRAVVQEGTGARLRSLGRTLAGKTGTTNDYSDAWFMGFSPELTTGVWVGNDDNAVLGYGESGGKTALPIWGEYMKTALAPYPRRDFEVPALIEFQRIDRDSGLLAGANTQDAYFQPFLEGTAPLKTFTEETQTKKTRQAARDDIF